MRETLELPADQAAELEQLRQRLHYPSRDALLAALVVQGMAAVRAQLEGESYRPTPRDRAAERARAEQRPGYREARMGGLELGA
jgi:hypothetical protein